MVIPNNTDDVFCGYGVKIILPEADNFLKIKETLSRIGVAAKDEKILYQSCHILHKRDYSGNSKYAIMHFKEMFKLDGKQSNLDEVDLVRRDTITSLLKEWGLLSLETGVQLRQPMLKNIKIVSFKDRKDWKFVVKYTIGSKTSLYNKKEQ